jgi:hypothetical protein
LGDRRMGGHGSIGRSVENMHAGDYKVTHCDALEDTWDAEMCRVSGAMKAKETQEEEKIDGEADTVENERATGHFDKKMFV